MLVSAPDGINFITSDQPFFLIWLEDKHPLHPPGFDSLDTQLILPLTQKMAMIGQFENGPDTREEATQEQVAGINSFILSAARNFVFSPTENFLFRSFHTREVMLFTETNVSHAWSVY